MDVAPQTRPETRIGICTIAYDPHGDTLLMPTSTFCVFSPLDLDNDSLQLTLPYNGDHANTWIAYEEPQVRGAKM